MLYECYGFLCSGCVRARNVLPAGRVGDVRANVAGMIVAFSISPAGSDETGGVAEAVAEAVRVVRASGLPHETNAMFTNIEGEWDEVMAVVTSASSCASRAPSYAASAVSRAAGTPRLPASVSSSDVSDVIVPLPWCDRRHTTGQ